MLSTIYKSSLPNVDFSSEKWLFLKGIWKSFWKLKWVGAPSIEYHKQAHVCLSLINSHLVANTMSKRERSDAYFDGRSVWSTSNSCETQLFSLMGVLIRWLCLKGTGCQPKPPWKAEEEGLCETHEVQQGKVQSPAKRVVAVSLVSAQAGVWYDWEQPCEIGLGNTGG